jgi:hypothetical protein
MTEEEIVSSEIDTDQENDTDVDVEVEVKEDDSADSSDDIEKLKAENAKLKAILIRKKKGESEGKEVKPQAQTEGLSKDELIAFAQGHSEEEVEMLKKISQVEGVSLKDAKESVMFKAYKDAKDAEIKAQKAQLSASKGSGGKGAQKAFNTPGLSRDEHRELFKKATR